MDRYELAAKITALLESPLAAEGYDLLDVRIFRGGGRITIRVFLDTEAGIDIGRCALASRSVGYLLEEADMIPEAHVVEVSSPGVRRPLRTRAHFAAAVGQDIIVKTFTGKATRTLKGRLLELKEDHLWLSLQQGPDEPHRVELGMIREASLDPDLDVQALINADRRKRKAEKRLKREERRNRN